MYAFQSNTELVLVFQSIGPLVPFGIPAESGQNVPPSARGTSSDDDAAQPATSVNLPQKNVMGACGTCS